MNGRGHRLLPHTADVIVEAWGPDLESCCEEAVTAMTAAYLDTGAVVVSSRHRFGVPPGEGEDLILAALEEVILLLDSSDEVPVAARVRGLGGGGHEITIDLADRDSVTVVGAAPKGVSLSDLLVEGGEGETRARLIIDV